MCLSLLSLAILSLAACGIEGHQPKKIIGFAEEVRPGENPYQVSLWRKQANEPNIWIYSCGGAILDNKHILTAAHCVNGTDPSKIRIKAGCVDMMEPNGTMRDVTVIRVHPDFGSVSEKKGGYLINDIAILTINDALPLDNNFMAAIKLPKNDVKAHQLGEVAGWGSRSSDNINDLSRVLLKIRMLTKKRKSCPRTIPKSQFCAVEFNLESTVGTGDSGSPFVIKNAVAGIVSRSFDGNSPLLPTHFTNVYSYLRFIKKILKKC